MVSECVVIIGVGDIGLACARRFGAGRRLVLADFQQKTLDRASEQLSGAGFDVLCQQVDVADAEAVTRVARSAQGAGTLRTLVNTAGLSPTMADARRIYAVDLLGTALVMDAFLPLAGPGTAAIMIASVAASLLPIDAELERRLALLPSERLLDAVADVHPDDPYGAYGVSKRGNQLRVEAAAAAWGARGARIVSLSPGLIHTGMAQQEARAHDGMAAMRAATPMDRWGTVEDIAAAVDWLAGPSASFVSGIDLRVDGGVVSAMRWAPPAA
jgi:NAD(P)-dependent dehydrogenase (short-subunit alcohol dehydrogenase family)